jgi:hypothetical protein
LEKRPRSSYLVLCPCVGEAHTEEQLAQLVRRLRLCLLFEPWNSHDVGLKFVANARQHVFCGAEGIKAEVSLHKYLTNKRKMAQVSERCSSHTSRTSFSCLHENKHRCCMSQAERATACTARKSRGKVGNGGEMESIRSGSSSREKVQTFPT